jgi:hypothetical protein
MKRTCDEDIPSRMNSVLVDDFLSLEMISRWKMEVETLKAHVHRNYFPGHEKRGSAAYKSLTRLRRRSPI